MSLVKISKDSKSLSGTVDLVSSKSESNRVLIINSLLGDKININNLSNSDDTQLMKKLLESNQKELNTNNAGTVMRFLTSFFAIKDSETILTGAERMKERPIKELVDVLKFLGSDITYLEKENYPPLLIKGKKLSGGEISINGNISSQYITSLLLIAPLLENGLTINIKENISSKPYIEMTLTLMSYFGIKSSFEGSKIIVENQKYIPNNFTVESDWSSASYWYGMAAFAEKLDLKLLYLKKDSLQGDSIIAKIMESFGIKTDYVEDGVILSKTNNVVDSFEFDFSDCPDLAQTIAFLCTGLKIKAKLTGLESLRIKETDRIRALANEISKTNTKIFEGDNFLEIYPTDKNLNLNIPFSSYEDHRMVLGASMLSMIDEVSISDYSCISKSYPDFFNNLRKAYFNVKDC